MKKKNEKIIIENVFDFLDKNNFLKDNKNYQLINSESFSKIASENFIFLKPDAFHIENLDTAKVDLIIKTLEKALDELEAYKNLENSENYKNSDKITLVNHIFNFKNLIQSWKNFKIENKFDNETEIKNNLINFFYENHLLTEETKKFLERNSYIYDFSPDFINCNNLSDKVFLEKIQLIINKLQEIYNDVNIDNQMSQDINGLLSSWIDYKQKEEKRRSLFKDFEKQFNRQKEIDIERNRYRNKNRKRFT